MRWLMAVVIVLAMLAGCTKRAGGVGIGVGLGVAATGGVIASNPSGNARSEMGNAYLGGTIAILGGVVVLASLIGLAIGPTDAPAKGQ